MSKLTTQSNTHDLDKNCAKSIVERLEYLGLAPSEIARRCNVSQSRINGWKNGQKANNEYLQKLRALLNLRLPNHKAETFTVSKYARLALTKEDLDLFLTKKFKSYVASLPSLPFELREKFDSTESLESLNDVISDQYYTYIYKQVDSDINFNKKPEYFLHQKSPYAKPFSVLPSCYQKTMQLVLQQLQKAIQDAEEQIEKKKQDEKEKQKHFEATINYAFSHNLQRNFNYYNASDESIDNIKHKLLQSVKEAIQDFKYSGSYFSHPLAELVDVMERVAQFLDDSQFGPKYGFNVQLEKPNIYYSESITKPEGFIEFKDIEFAIDSAKKLKINFEKFIEEQDECYSDLFKYKEKELELTSKLVSNKVFNQKMCDDLTSGKILSIQDERLSNLGRLTDSILKFPKLQVALNGSLHDLELKNDIENMLNELTPEPITSTIQISGQLVFSISNDTTEQTLIYSLENNDLVLLQNINICNQQVLTIKPKLAAEELLNHVSEEIKVSVKQSLLEQGYMFSDIEVLG